MLVPDVNVLIYAHRVETAAQQRHRDWLTAALESSEPVGWCDHVLAGFVRIVTNRRAFVEATSLDQALEVCGMVLAGGASVRIGPGPDHWNIFASLCREIDASGNDVPDAYLAALAIERDATFVSEDRGFARFERLRWSSPFA